MSDQPASRGDDLLEIRTPILVREIGPGRCIAQAVASPGLQSFGSEVGAVDEQRRYLERALMSAGAREVARFAVSQDLELETIEVELRRLDLPARLRRPIRVALSCVVARQGRDRWVLLPALPHTLFVAAGEDLEAEVRREAARVVAAAEPGSLDVRRLLPARDTWLESVTAHLLVGADGLSGRARAMRKRRLEERRRARAREALAEAGVLLSSAAGESPPLLGRDEELARLERVLGGAARGGVLLVGDEAAGKSALMAHWLRRGGAGRTVLSTSVAQLVAGAGGFGEWQERVAGVLEAAELLDAVIYFENLGELFGERPERGGVDIAGSLRRHVIEERVRVVGEITGEGLERARRHHVALLGAMTALRIEPLEPEATVRAVAARVAHWRATDRDRPPVAAEVAQPVVDLARRYMPYRAFPGKAIRFLEELRATRETLRDADGAHRPIGLEECYEAFSLTSGIPSFLLREDRPLEKSALVRAFRRRMIGQAEAVDRVAETVCLVKARLQPQGKPLATFLFVGPTGVGKTELARTLADYLFGSADRMTRFDMSEYTDALAGERLIRGTVRADGLLTGQVRSQPFCVLLLDEIEKAHRSVHDLLLQVCGEGRLTDARGRTTHFENAIIIMTSNLGATHRRESLGIAAPPASDRDHYQRAVREAFRPEMLNRIDRVVPFAPLTPEEVAEVARLAVARVGERRGIQEASLELEISEAATAALARGGFSEIYGVRALRRHLDDRLVTPLAHELARLGQVARGAAVWVGLEHEEPPGRLSAKQRISSSLCGELRIELFRRAAAVGRVALRGVAAAAAMRRECDALFALDEAEDIAARVASLRAELATAAAPRSRRRRKDSSRRDRALGARMETLRRTFHRLERIATAASAARSDLHVAEELAITAVLEGEELAALDSEVGDVYRRFRRTFFWVLVADREPASHVYLRAARINGASPLRLWLAPMLAWAERRDWEVVAHLPGEKGVSWPRGRAWGPPRSAAWLASRLESNPAAFDRLLLRVGGAGAAELLAVETGLHRFRGYSNEPHGDHLKIDLVAFGPELEGRDWANPALAAPPPRAVARKATLSRERSRGEDTVLVCGDRPVDLAAYPGYFEALEELGLETLLAARQRGTIAAQYAPLTGGEA